MKNPARDDRKQREGLIWHQYRGQSPKGESVQLNSLHATQQSTDRKLFLNNLHQGAHVVKPTQWKPNRNKAIFLKALLAASIFHWVEAREAWAACDASNSTCMDSEALWSYGGPSTFFSMASAQTLGAKQLGFGVATSLQRKPIIFNTSGNSPTGSVSIPAIDYQLTSSFLFSYGITDRAQVDIVAPITLFQDGDIGRRAQNAPVGTNPTSTAVRDIRLGAAYSLLGVERVEKPRGIGLTARFDLSIPTGDEALIAGDRTVVAVPSLALEARYSQFLFGAQSGFKFRGKTQVFGRNVASQAFWGLGVSAAIDKRRTFELTGELWGSASLVDSGISPIQWLAGVKWSGLGAGDFFIHAGAGGSLRGSAGAQLTEPSWRATLDVRFMPLSRDTDGDGIPDRLDKCPYEPEDKDGFQDSDGCPDPDNDGDGIPDFRDQCPNEPEDKDGYKDDDGCPDPDNDGDGIPDEKDKCPNQPEDYNGYQDDDGCPDGGPPKVPEVIKVFCADGTLQKQGQVCDSDNDGIPDDKDKCPLVAEDKDGIADDDGCPERDADEDGVADELDKCPLEPETINGVADDDGCPEPGAKSIVTFAQGAIDIEKPARFTAKSSVVGKSIALQLTLVSQRLQGLVDRGIEKIVVQGWADDNKDNEKNQKLALARAEAIVTALEKTGIPASKLRAVVGDLTDPPAKDKANYLVTVRFKKKATVLKLEPKP